MNMRRVLSLLFFYFLCLNSFAEGTKELQPNGLSSTGRMCGLQFLRFETAQMGSYGATEDQRINISVKEAGETIYMGFGGAVAGNNPSAGNLTDIVFRVRRWSDDAIVFAEQALPTAGQGFINDYDESVAGPSNFNAAGYNALSFTAPSAGDYYIEFSRNGYVVGGPYSEANNGFSITLFDITVADGATIKPGRLFAKIWEFNMFEFGPGVENPADNRGRAFAKFFCYTGDSVVTTLGLNGMRPFGFTVVCNKNGTIETGDFFDARQSVNGANQNYREYPIFLNNPDEDLYPSGDPAFLTSQPFIFGCPKDGFEIKLSTNKSAFSQVLIDLDGTPGPNYFTEDVILEVFLEPGENAIPWDGKDGFGNDVTVGITIDAEVRIISGITNFPIFDAEYNANGFDVGLQRPAGTVPLAYWDDVNIPDNPGAGTDTGTEDRQLDGSVVPGHQWTNFNYGNNNTINTWWYTFTLVELFTYEIVVNCPPEGMDDLFVTDEDISLNANILTNDLSTDAGDILSLTTSPIVAPSNGTVILNSDGTIAYTPNPDFVGQDSFDYEVCDNGIPTLCSQATVIIDVNAVNDAPLAVDDNVNTNINTDVSISVLSNDTDDEGSPLTLTNVPVTPPANGTLILNPSGDFVYSPNSGFEGVDSFVYEICDDGAPTATVECSQATVIISVGSANQAPNTTTDLISTNKNVAVTGNVLVNDSDSDGDDLSVNTTPVFPPNNGTLTLNPDGSFTYVPFPGFFGSDAFTYEVCDNGTPVLCAQETVEITVLNVNSNPVATNDNFVAAVDEIVQGNLFTNDSDPDGNSISLDDAFNNNLSGSGELQLSSNGLFIYEPSPGETGTVTFDYQICDNGNPVLCDQATASISIGATNNPPTARDDFNSLNEESSITSTVILNDSDPDADPLTFSLVGGTAPNPTTEGTLVFNADGSYVFTPVADFADTVFFDYEACDNGSPVLCSQATVRLIVSDVNDAPVATADNASGNEDEVLTNSVSGNDSDVDGANEVLTYSILDPETAGVNGALVLNPDGTYSFTPNENVNGTFTFSYQVCDDGSPNLCDVAQVTLTINPVNDGPVAVNDSSLVLQDVNAVGSLTTNDTDLEMNALTIDPSDVGTFNFPGQGSLTIGSNGAYTFDPTSAFLGQFTYDYTVCDPEPLCDEATLVVDVFPVGNPIAINDTSRVNQDVNATGNIITNDSDPESDPLTVSSPGAFNFPGQGALALSTNGDYTFNPEPNFVGEFDFTYEVCDNNATPNCSEAVLTIIVNGAPVAVDDVASTNEDTPVSGNLIVANDTDPEGDALTLDSPGTVALAGGSIQTFANGSYIYSPNPGNTSGDVFNYTVCDSKGACSDATLTISINNNPVANPDNESVDEETTLNANVGSNDTDANDLPGALTYTLVDGSNADAKGTLTFNPDGSYTYVPDQDSTGTATFTYEVCDDASPAQGCDIGTVTITINEINDAPVATNEFESILQGQSLNGDLRDNVSDVDDVLADLSFDLTVATAPDPVTEGTVVINPDGTYTFTPVAGFTGSVTFEYRVRDDGAPRLMDVGEVTVTVNPSGGNLPPVAGDDAFMVNEDATLTDDVRTNDADPDNATSDLTYSILNPGTSSAEANGTLTFNSAGEFTYVPNTNFNGVVSFNYQVCDPSSSCDIATTEITVVSQNDPPVAVANNGTSTSEDNPVTINTISLNDTDIDGTVNASSITLIDPNNVSNTGETGNPLVIAGVGTYTVDASGNVVFSPSANFNGDASINYTVEDNEGLVSNISQIGINVTSVNDAPSGQDSTVTILEDNSLTLTEALLGYTDPENDALTQVTINTLPSNGTLTIGGVPVVLSSNNVISKADLDAGNLVFTPGVDESGNPYATLNFTVNDGSLDDLAPNTVTVNVTPVADAPDAVDNNGNTILEDNPSPLVINAITANDTDADGNNTINSSTIILIDPNDATNNATVGSNLIIAGVGTYVSDAGGNVTFTPAPNYNGPANVNYTVRDNTGLLSDVAQIGITVTDVNDAPIAIANNGNTIAEDSPTALTITTIAGNDTDVDGMVDASTITLIDPSDASNTGSTGTPLVISGVGTYTVDASGNVVFSPATNFNGDASINYTVEDNDGTVSNEAPIGITVTDVNDAPIAVANNGNTIAEDSPTALTVTTIAGNDTDVDGTADASTITLIDPSDASNTGSTGTPLVISGVGTYTVDASGNVVFTPATNFNGDASINYTVEDNDGTVSNEAPIGITVTDVNDAPIAVANNGNTIAEDSPTALTITTIAGNDTDVDGTVDASTITLIDPSDASNTGSTGTPLVISGVGTYTVDASGNVVFTPATNFNGDASINYTVEDNDGTVSNEAPIGITVTDVNDAPIAVANNGNTIAEDSPTALTITTIAGNDTDVDGTIDASTITLIDPSDASNTGSTGTPLVISGVGTYTVDASGNVVFSPATNFNGDASINYTVEDNDGTVSNEAPIGITVTDVNDAPIAVANNGNTIAEDSPTALTITTIASNDTDVDGTVDASTITLIDPSDVSNTGSTGTPLVISGVGTYTVDASGNVVFSPATNFNGDASINYTVEDNDGTVSNEAPIGITVTDVNDAPIAVANNGNTIAEDSPTALTVTTIAGNDTDVDGTVDASTITLIDPSDVSNTGSTGTPLVISGVGTYTVDASGNVVFSPATNFNGDASINYTVEDNDGTVSNEAPIGITVTDVNDAPIAVVDNVSITEGTASTDINVLLNDTDIENNIDNSSVNILSETVTGNGGLVSVNPDGTITYEPLTNFAGVDTIVYEVCDLESLCDSDTLFVTIIPVEDDPDANVDNVAINEDSGLSNFDVAANDTDADGDLDPSSVSILSQSGGGTASVLPDGTIDYTPNLNFNGVDTIVYQICDSRPFCVSDTLFVTVNPVNDDPVAINDTVSTNEDVSITVNVQANDTDVDQDNLTTTIVNQPSNGTAVVINGDSILYTPNSNFEGIDTINYRICDASSACDDAQIIINVLPQNDFPITTGDNVTVDEDNSVTIDVQSNDTDVDNDPLTTSILVPPSNGTVVLVNGDSITYTPDTNFNGVDTIVYQISDGNGGVASDTIFITVDPVNDNPVAATDLVTTDENVAVTIDVQLNDIDSDNDPLNTTIISNGSNGNATVLAGDSIVYMPNMQFVGVDTIIYQISDGKGGVASDTIFISVNNVNDVPVAVEDNVTTDEDVAVTIDVQSNDTDLDNDLLTTTILDNGSNGTAVVVNGDSIIYTPNTDFAGLDTIVYEISDGNGGVDSDTVFITINQVNDNPQIVDSLNNPIDQVIVTTNEDQDLSVKLEGVDVDGNLIDVTNVISGPNNGVVTNVNGGDTTFTYTPNPNFNGSDTLEAVVCDDASPMGCDTVEVIINVAPVNDRPVALNDNAATDPGEEVNVHVLANDTDADEDPLTLTIIGGPNNGVASVDGDSIKYTPDATFLVGSDTLLYLICDGSLCDTAEVVIFVPDSELPPVAEDDMITVAEDETLKFDVLNNDIDPNGDPLTITTVTSSSGGTVTIDGDSLVYMPSPNFAGTDSILYTVCDNTLPTPLCDTAIVVVTVTPVNDDPIITDGNGNPLVGSIPVIVDEDDLVEIVLNGTDVDNDNLDVTSIIDGPTNGTITGLNDGDTSLTYIPNPDYNGQDTLKAIVCDDGVPQGCDTIEIVISVNPINDAPIAVEDFVTTVEETPILVDVQVNDVDTDGDTLITSIVSGGTNGVVTVQDNDSILYIPNTDFIGLDTIVYQITDGNGGTAQDTIFVTVSNTNDSPITGNDFVSVDEENNVVIDVQLNDTDPDDDVLSTSVLVNPTNGVVTVLNGDSILYTPNTDFFGVDTIVYQVNDNNGGVSTDTVFVTVNNINDAPEAVDDVATTPEETIITVDVQNNDIDVDNDVLTTSIISQGLNGTALVVNGDSISYTPNTNFNGNDTIVYRVCDPFSECDEAILVITVTESNDAPIANTDKETVEEDNVILLDVQANDNDPDGDNLVTTVISVPNGTTSVLNGDSISYQPNSNFNGTDTIVYEVCDPSGLCAVDTAFITVTPVNDAPELVNNVGTPITELIVTTNEDESIEIPLDLVDIENDSVDVVSIVSGLSNGTITGLNTGDTTLTYIPNPEFNGVDTIGVLICDNGTPMACNIVEIVINVDPVNDAPVAETDFATTDPGVEINTFVLSNDSDIDGDVLTVAIIDGPSNGNAVLDGDSIKYTPDVTFLSGLDTVTYTACDAFVCDTALLVIFVPVSELSPLALDDRVTILEDMISTINVLSNDIEPNGDTLIITSVSSVVPGSNVTITGDSLTYTPALDFVGVDTIEYIVCDQANPTPLCDTAIVVVTVNPVNDNPIITDDLGTPLIGNIPVALDEDETLDIKINATDMEDDLLDITSIIDGPTNGTFTGLNNGDTTFTYIPNPDFNGQDTLKAVVCDNGIPQGCDTVEVIITVNPVNDAPLASTDRVSTDEDVSVTIDVQDNDIDVDGDELTTTIVSGGNNGIVTVVNGDSVTYVPSTNFVGIDTIVYQITDGSGETAQDTIFVTVTNVNDAPIAEVDFVSTFINTPINVDVQNNDSDIDGDKLTTTVVVRPKNGTTIVVNADSILYLPFRTFEGLDTLVYEVCDPSGSCAMDTVFITVGGINSPPVTPDNIVETTTENTPIDVKINAVDPNGDNVDVTNVVDGPTNGTIVLTTLSTGDTTFTYTPNPGFIGNDTMRAVVCDDGSPVACDTVEVIISVVSEIVNNAPTIDVDTLFTTTPVSTPLTINITATDLDLDSLDVTALLDGPFNGIVSGLNTGDTSFIYTPDSNFVGLDSMRAVVCDNASSPSCDTVVVFITVTPLEDTIEIITIDDDVTTSLNEDIEINILENDSLKGLDLTIDNVSLVTNPSSGTVIKDVNGYVYTPNVGFVGIDSFRYQLCTPSGVCDTALVVIRVEGEDDTNEFEIFNGISPDNDGQNDVFIIRGIEEFPNNKVYIYNRWGNLVYEQDSYDYRDPSKSFYGQRTEGLGIGEELPEGTYYYIIEFNDNSGSEPLTGFLELDRD